MTIQIGGPQASVLEYFTSWLERITPTLRPEISVQYEQVVHKHILPMLGHLSEQELKAEQIQELYRMKRQAGYGSRTISLINCLLHHALSDAVVDGILFSNPAKKIPKPRQPYHEQKVLNIDQVKAFLQVYQGTRWEAVFYLAISSGMRAGELSGLRWTDIDWEQERLQVVRQVQRIPRQGLHFLEPKAVSSRRSIILGQEMIMKLLAHRQRQEQERQLAGDHWHENNLVFPTPIGTPLDPHRLLNVYKEFLKEAGLPDCRLHDLRHAAATLMLWWGIHPKVVQERLEHAHISYTLGIYSHVLPTIQGEAAEKMDTFLLCAKEEETLENG